MTTSAEQQDHVAAVREDRERLLVALAIAYYRRGRAA
jgi:hypothetical protein